MALSDYELHDLVARTNMSEVWSAIDTRTGHQVAIKRRPPGIRAERRFAREIEAQHAASGLHTMPVLDWDESRDWYAMPWASGTLAEREVPDESLVVSVVDAVTASLAEIHARGQVHRDLKPENILWLEDDQPARWVVADFGIVRNAQGETTATLTIAGRMLGTSGWMAPEQDGDAHGATPSTDVFAVGAIMSWLITGRRPRPGRVELPDYSSSFRHVVWKATRDRQSDRYANLGDLQAAVSAASAPSADPLADMVANRDFAGLVKFSLSGASAYLELVEELPRLDGQDVRCWFSGDPNGLSSTVVSVLDSLVDSGIEDLSFAKIDRFLSWSLKAIEVDLAHDQDRAERTATALFRAIAEIHQFAPAKDVLEWLDRRSTGEQRVMESAILMAGAWEFFATQASGRFVTSRTTPLVRRLSGELSR